MKILVVGQSAGMPGDLLPALDRLLQKIPNAPKPAFVVYPEGESPMESPALDADVIASESPLTFIDFRGPVGRLHSLGAERVSQLATHAILVVRAETIHNKSFDLYLEAVDDLDLPTLAILKVDDLDLKDEAAECRQLVVFFATLHDFDSIFATEERDPVRELAAFLAWRVEQTNYRIVPFVNTLLDEWRAKLGPDYEVELAGSLRSDTFILEGREKIDADIRFCVADPGIPEHIARIEAVTGLRYRTSIDVNDWPDGMSRAHLIEGCMSIPGMTLPLKIEGCLRNRRRANWHELYLKYFTRIELERYRRTKFQLRNQPDEYMRLKRGVQTECSDRVFRSQGYGF